MERAYIACKVTYVVVGKEIGDMFRRRGTTSEEKRPVQTMETPIGEGSGSYRSDVRQDRPVSAPPRGNGHAIREAERVTEGETMMEPRPIGFGQYLANWFTLLVGTALVLAEGVLAFRLFLKLASASNTNWIVKFDYHLSSLAIKPFIDVFQNHELAGGIFEPSVVVAMVLYLIGAVLAIWVVRSLATLRSWGGLFWR